MRKIAQDDWESKHYEEVGRIERRQIDAVEGAIYRLQEVRPFRIATRMALDRQYEQTMRALLDLREAFLADLKATPSE